MRIENIRNVAIIAHVDHGKTTLVDKLLYQSGMFRSEDLDKLAGGIYGLIMDTDPIERERGITIFSKNCAIRYKTAEGHEFKINIIDTPGHADFGGEVERVLKMADGVLLLVDAFEGPMPQTRYVLQKALQHDLRPIVVINKVDRPNARPNDVLNEVFDLLVALDADDEALDFPAIYSSGKEGWATEDLAVKGQDLRPVLDAILKHVPPPRAYPDMPSQMLVTTLDYSDYLGRIAIGRVFAGRLTEGEDVVVINREGQHSRQRIQQLFEFEGLDKKPVNAVKAGDICAVVGLDPIEIGNTIADAEDPQPLPGIMVDEPTIHMTFRVNDGPFAGRDGTYVTSRQLKDRLDKELQSNVALRVAQAERAEEFQVSGRGLMHLGILLENMRREGYEVCVGKPKVIFKEVKGEQYEPIERLAVDCPAECQSAVLSLVGERRAQMTTMEAKAGATGFVHMEFSIPVRGLLGMAARMANATQGRAIMHHTFEEYAPIRGAVPQRLNGVMVATHSGQVTAYALDALYDRGVFFVKVGDPVYEGQIVGEHCKEQDLPVNAVRAKHQTNVRSSTKEDGARVRPMREMSLEMALEYIQDDEMVEITPKAIRIRKRVLNGGDRRRSIRSKAMA